MALTPYMQAQKALEARRLLMSGGSATDLASQAAGITPQRSGGFVVGNPGGSPRFGDPGYSPAAIAPSITGNTGASIFNPGVVTNAGSGGGGGSNSTGGGSSGGAVGGGGSNAFMAAAGVGGTPLVGNTTTTTKAGPNNSAAINNLIAALRSQSALANKDSLAQYQQLLGTVSGTAGKVDKYLGQLGKTGETRIAQNQGIARGKAESDLVSRGLGNTTIRQNVLSGVDRDAEQARQALGESLAQQKIGTTMQLGQMQGDAILSRQNVGPDISQYLALLAQLGR